MNSKHTCRLIGWVFVFLGSVGLTAAHLGTYMQFSNTESALYLGFGICSIFAARRRRRDAALTAFLTGMCYLLWCSNGFSHLLSIGSVEPFDTLIQALAAIWGIGTAIHEAVLWRQLISATL